MKTLLNIGDPNNFTIEDFYELSPLGKLYEGTKEDFISKYSDSDVFYNWTVERDYFDEVDIYEQLNSILKKTKIKNGFLEIINNRCRDFCYHISLSKINAQNILSKISINGYYTIEIKKDGHQLSFIRYSHDEPTGTTIYLRNKNEHILSTLFTQLYNNLNYLFNERKNLFQKYLR